MQKDQAGGEQGKKVLGRGTKKYTDLGGGHAGVCEEQKKGFLSKRSLEYHRTWQR